MTINEVCTLARYASLNGVFRARTEIPADCLGIQVVPRAAVTEAAKEFFAQKAHERKQRKAEDEALLQEPATTQQVTTQQEA